MRRSRCRSCVVRLSGSARRACPVRSFHSSASGSAALRLVMLGQSFASSALSWMMCCWSPGTSSSGTIALTGHSGMQTAQSMHSSGSMVRKFGPSRKQSTGQTSTQSVYLQRMHDSRTTWVMVSLWWMRRRSAASPDRAGRGTATIAGSLRLGVRPARCCSAARSRSGAAPTPTVTTVGRPACSTAAAASVGDACGRWRSGRASRRATPPTPACRRASPRRAAGATARPSCLPGHVEHLGVGARGRRAARRSCVIAVVRLDAAAAAAARERALRGRRGGQRRGDAGHDLGPMPAAASAWSSSSRRPNTLGSPPFRRTTTSAAASPAVLDSAWR